MKWEDTVIHLDDIDEGRMPDSYASLRKALEKQAEISFLLGEEQGKQKGIKEVVEFVDENSYGFDNSDGVMIRKMVDDDWQAQLKEWGIDKGTLL